MVRKSRLSTVVLTAGCLLGLVVFTSEQSIRDWLEDRKVLDFSKIPLETVGRRVTHLREGAPGYVIFYSNVVQCTGCIREVNGLKEIAAIYPEIAFYAIVKDDKNVRLFIEALDYMGIPGDYFLDVQGRIQNRLGLGDHPQLLFLDSEMKLVAVLPVDIRHDDLIRQIHRYIAVM